MSPWEELKLTPEGETLLERQAGERGEHDTQGEKSLSTQKRKREGEKLAVFYADKGELSGIGETTPCLKKKDKAHCSDCYVVRKQIAVSESA